MNQRDDYSYELISAFLDGEVSPDERARVERLVASSAEHRQVLEDLRAVTRGMQRLPDYYLDGEFSQRVSAIARQTSGMAHEAEVAQSIPVTLAATVWYWPAVVGLTVTAAAVALIAFFVSDRDADSIRSAGNQRVAQVPDAPADASRGEPTAVDETPLAVAPGRDSTGPSATVPLVDQPASEAPATSDTVVHTDLLPPGQPTIPSNSASSGEEAPPAPMVVVVEGTTSRLLPAQSRVRDPASSGDGERLPKALLNDIPFSGMQQQLLLVIDVALTQQGKDRGAFERVLAAHHIPVEGTVPVDPKLEESLLASRFFEPMKTPANGAQVARADLALMYVGARAGHVDAICSEMQSNPGEFAAISFDMAFLPNDQALFQKLQQAVQQLAADGPPVSDARRRERRAAAHRLTLSPSWRGTFSQKLKGVEGLTDLVPDPLLDRDAAQKPLIERVPGQPPPQVPLLPGGRLGENIDAEVLFVVHVGRSTQE